MSSFVKPQSTIISSANAGAETVMGSGRTLAVHLYSLWSEGLRTEQAYATAVILLVVVIILNVISTRLEKLTKGRSING